MKKPHIVLRAVVLPLLVLLGVLTVLTYSKFRTFVGYANQAERARTAMVTLSNMMKTVTEAETNQRGFLLTNDTTFLQAYRASIARLDVQARQMETIGETEITLEANVDTLQALLKTRTRILAYVIALRAGGHNIPKDSMLAGQRVMEQIRRHVETTINKEQHALDKAVAETKSLISLTPLLMLVLSLFSIAVLLAGYIFMSRELSKRLDAQLLLEQKIGDLNRSNRELEQFAYVASHDLQEPLRKIQAFGDRMVIKNSDAMNEDVRLGVSKMQNAAARMQVLIDDLLSYSRVLHLEDEFVEVDLNTSLQDVLSDLEISIRNKSASVQADALPVIRAVPFQMQQLFLNLLSNALKFAKPAMPPRVQVRYAQVSGKDLPDVNPHKRSAVFHRISVIDDGVGFNAEYNKKIFVIFQQLHNKMEYGGTGIGLAVCKKIAENHGGFIVAESEPGQGAAFHVFIPVA
ncbi:MAG TPA: ATP-binding protein [Chitinophagales bacterium]|nr:ATP-binding protein [Chitinophagales bacterium]